MLILSGQDVDECLPIGAAVAGMREAFAAVSAHRVELPDRTLIPLGDDSQLALFMPAYVKNSPFVTVKSVTVFPENGSHSLPSVQSIVQVFDASTGSPVALIDGTRLTAIRTAAGGAASVELLAREECSSLAMIGSGTQARAGIEAVCHVRASRPTIRESSVCVPGEQHGRAPPDTASGHPCICTCSRRGRAGPSLGHS